MYCHVLVGVQLIPILPRIVPTLYTWVLYRFRPGDRGVYRVYRAQTSKTVGGGRILTKILKYRTHFQFHPNRHENTTANLLLSQSEHQAKSAQHEMTQSKLNEATQARNEEKARYYSVRLAIELILKIYTMTYVSLLPALTSV